MDEEDEKKRHPPERILVLFRVEGGSKPSFRPINLLIQINLLAAMCRVKKNEAGSSIFI